MSNVVQAHNLKAQAVWNSAGGRYDEISHSIADAIEHAVERLEPIGLEDPGLPLVHVIGQEAASIIATLRS